MIENGVTVYLNYCCVLENVYGVNVHCQLYMYFIICFREETFQRISCLEKYGLYGSIEYFLSCGLCTHDDKEYMKNFESRIGNDIPFETEDGLYYPQISEEKKTKLKAALNELENNPTSLQRLCRSRIRKELSVSGNSIFPLVEKLSIPEKLKSFLKFEDVEEPMKEIVIADFMFR